MNRREVFDVVLDFYRCNPSCSISPHISLEYIGPLLTGESRVITAWLEKYSPSSKSCSFCYLVRSLSDYSSFISGDWSLMNWSYLNSFIYLILFMCRQTFAYVCYVDKLK